MNKHIDETKQHDYTEWPVEREADYAMCHYLRIGANVMADLYDCPERGRLVDPKLSHSTGCVKAEHTGRFAVVRVRFDWLAEVDTSAVLEQRGLVETEPGARLGDIFTTAAVLNRDAAVDVTVLSQEVAGAEDCVRSSLSQEVHTVSRSSRRMG